MEHSEKVTLFAYRLSLFLYLSYFTKWKVQ